MLSFDFNIESLQDYDTCLDRKGKSRNLAHSSGIVELQQQLRKSLKPHEADNMKYRQFPMEPAKKYGVSRSSSEDNNTRSYIYFCLGCHDGSRPSLVCQSHRPHRHPTSMPNQKERKLTADMHRQDPDLGIVKLCAQLRK